MPGTTIREAIQKWEASEKNGGCKACEATFVDIKGQMPPIEKIDASLSTLVKCQRLALSTNMIDKIANLNGLKNLNILSLARNNIKNLTGLEAVGETLTELWISYNNVEKLKGINVLKKLKVLYMSNNNVKDFNEFGKLAELPQLTELLFVGNPLEEDLTTAGTWRDKATGKLAKLKKLDGVPVIRENDDDEEEQD